MLFDLRGRGRRRTVRVVYVGLALLFAVGFVGFGVGVGGSGGGILNALTGGEGSGSSIYAGQIKKYEKLVKKEPSNADGWRKLTTAELHEAGGEEYVTNNVVNGKGKTLYVKVAESWNSYLALKPSPPNTELAQQMLRIYGEEGLNKPTEAVKVLQIVIAARPNSYSLFAQLAEYAYKAKNVGIGDLASEKAVKLAPSSSKVSLKKELASLKEHPNPQSEELSATEGGKSYKVKSNGNGSYSSTGAGTTATTTTTTTTTTTPAGAADKTTTGAKTTPPTSGGKGSASTQGGSATGTTK